MYASYLCIIIFFKPSSNLVADWVLLSCTISHIILNFFQSFRYVFFHLKNI